ncbi:unknown; predicted coding region [Mycoplasmopsis pulmonis]|uniref:Uncharacterized protein n=1 Tax=Mycoplasmopsis pulmonis (strain UAB CTIP) TaxID=272635 RepID=Q98PK7_MYCPU|nr:unknown; predicted coding region [Mycoplasmopsis pulmonis]
MLSSTINNLFLKISAQFQGALILWKKSLLYYFNKLNKKQLTKNIVSCFSYKIFVKKLIVFSNELELNFFGISFQF